MPRVRLSIYLAVHTTQPPLSNRMRVVLSEFTSQRSNGDFANFLLPLSPVRPGHIHFRYALSLSGNLVGVCDQPLASSHHPHLQSFCLLSNQRGRRYFCTQPYSNILDSLHFSQIPATFIREMSDALHGDPEELRSDPEKKTLLILSSFFSLSLGYVRRIPFLSSIVISVILAGIVASTMNRSYTDLDKRNPYRGIPPGGSGVSGFTAALTSCVLIDGVSH